MGLPQLKTDSVVYTSGISITLSVVGQKSSPNGGLMLIYYGTK